MEIIEMNSKLCFLVLPLMMSAWRKKDALFCTSHWDCPHHQHRHAVFAGVGICSNPPFKPVWVPIPVPVEWNLLKRRTDIRDGMYYDSIRVNPLGRGGLGGR
jgi:hypothetical protein